MFFSAIFIVIRIGLGNKICTCLVTLISPLCSLTTKRKGKITIGNKAMIRAFTELKTCDGIISVGDKVFINRYCIINAHERISIGNGTTIGPGTYIYDHDHDGNGGYRTSAIEIGSNVWIGAGCIILKGTRIGDNAVIGAGTLIAKDVESNTLLLNERTRITKALK